MIDLIIPVYNAKKTLFKTLCSVALQTIKDKIIVYIIDDCSTDDYTEILNSFKDELRIVYEKLDKNVGPGVARQYILDKTNSPYICFLDSDDLLYYPDSLEKQYNVLEKGNKIVISYVVDERDNNKCHSTGDLHGKMFSREILINDRIKFPQTRVHEDNVFVNLALIYNPDACYLENIGYLYCNNNESVTAVSSELEFERIKIFIENADSVIRQTIHDNCATSAIKNYIAVKTAYLSRLYNSSIKEKKEKLKRWVKESLLDENYLDITDSKNLKEKIFEEPLSKYDK